MVDQVSVYEQTDVTDQFGNRSHYEVRFTHKRADGASQRFERVELEVRCNGHERIRVEMPGEVGLAMFWCVRQAFEKFDIEQMSGRKVSL